MKKIAIVALLTAFAATPALADNSGKFYVAGDFGLPTYSNASTNPATGINGTFPNPKTMLRIAGGMHINPMVAVELGYSMFGDSVLTGPVGNFTLSTNSFQVAAVGTYPLSPEFDLIGKLGLANNSSNASGFVNGSSAKTDLMIGVGAQYHIDKEYSVRVQYDSFGKFQDASYTNPLKATALSAGVVYQF